jgi:hypothetical protein
LTDENFSLGPYEYNTAVRIGEDDGQYLNDFSNLTIVSIINTPINSYEIICGTKNLQRYCLQDINWNITEDDTRYRFRGKIEKNDDNQTYYYLDQVTQDYVLYKEDYPSAVNLYTKHVLINDEGIIDNIPVLEFLQGRGTIDGLPVA